MYDEFLPLNLHLLYWSYHPKMNNIESDVLKGYRFLGGAISVYSVSCMSNVIFNPSLLNWSSLILTVAHIYYIIATYSYHTIPLWCIDRCAQYQSHSASVIWWPGKLPNLKLSNESGSARKYPEYMKKYWTSIGNKGSCVEWFDFTYYIFIWILFDINICMPCTVLAYRIPFAEKKFIACTYRKEHAQTFFLKTTFN